MKHALIWTSPAPGANAPQDSKLPHPGHVRLEHVSSVPDLVAKGGIAFATSGHELPLEGATKDYRTLSITRPLNGLVPTTLVHILPNGRTLFWTPIAGWLSADGKIAEGMR